MNDIQVFNNEEFGNIRTVEIDGEPWFVGKDIALALGYKDTADGLKNHVDDEDKRLVKVGEIPTLETSNFGAYIINESGLYSLILGSRLPSAKKFKRWVTSDVLPAIRQTGSYNLPQTYSEALRALADQAEKTEQLRLENSEMKPKAEFFDAVAGSRTAISLGDVAKVLAYPKVGRNKLFEILRDRDILQSNNLPYQKYIDAGYFRVIEQKYNVGDEVRINLKTLVYQKGIDYIKKTLDEVAT